MSTLAQESGIAFTPDVTQRLNQLEQELHDGQLSPQSQQWLAVSQLTPDRLLPLFKPLPEAVVPKVIYTIAITLAHRWRCSISRGRLAGRVRSVG